MCCSVTLLANYALGWNVLVSGGVGVVPAGEIQVGRGAGGLHSYQLVTQFSPICQFTLESMGDNNINIFTLSYT